MNKTVYLVRHCEYQNPENINPGNDIIVPLTEEGVKRMQKEARYFIDKSIQKIYSSPVQRAIDTSNIVKNIIDLDIKIDERLRENEMPLHEGMKWGAIAKDNNNKSIFVNSRHIEAGGETYKEVLMRMKSIISEVEDRSILVSHGDPLAIIIASLLELKIDISEYMSKQMDYPPRGSITVIELDNNLKLNRLDKVNY